MVPLVRRYIDDIGHRDIPDPITCEMLTYQGWLGLHYSWELLVGEHTNLLWSIRWWYMSSQSPKPYRYTR
jgi:hypothetical protein